MKLLNIDANAKTVKGQSRGYMTAVLYLSPWKSAGVNVCPMAELAGCHAGCLNTAGRGGISPGSVRFNPFGIELPDNSIQRARIARTRFFVENREGFMGQLVDEIEAFKRKAERLGLVPVVRLNGTSDIRWESVPVGPAPNVFAVFKGIQFYDYTKIHNRRIEGIKNYYLAISYSAASPRYAESAIKAAAEQGRNLVVVFGGEQPESFLGRPVVNGDESDLRFLDPVGVVVGLKAKGSARKDSSGFVVQPGSVPGPLLGARFQLQEVRA